MQFSDGSEDDKIRLEGLPDFKVPPPLRSLRGQVGSSVPGQTYDTVQDPPDVQEALEEQTAEESLDGDVQSEETFQEDLESDRDFTYPLVGKKFRCLYSTWVTGNIVWYNRSIKKYRIEFDDDTEDYVNLNEISRGTNMFLLPDA